MGLCLCKQLFCKIDEDMEISEIHKVETAMKILRNRIKGKNLPIIWLEGSENSGKQNHACNISERFGYNHIQIEKMIKEEADKTTRRGRYVKQKIILQRKIPDRLVIELIKEQMISVPDCNGYLISGFPQNPKQAQHFIREITPVDCILYLEGEAVDGAPVEKSIGDQIENTGNEDGDKKCEIKKNFSGSRIVTGKFDSILEKINANEPPADVFLKIEAAILDKTSNAS